MNILITGASSGFGKELALALASNGHLVYATMRAKNGRNKAVSEELERLGNGRIISLEMDVGSDESVEECIHTIVNDLTTPLDIVINNAGCYIGGLNETFSSSQVQQLFNVNLLGAIRVMRAALPTIRQQGKGTFVNITSNLSRMTMPMNGLYLASKSALETVSESYAYELAPLGIETLIVQPGAFNTGIMGKAMAPDDIERSINYQTTLSLTENMQSGYMEMVKNSYFEGSPQMIADAVIDLLAKPYGSRPFRTVVDPSMLGSRVEALNDSIAEHQDNFLHSINSETFKSVKGHN